MDDDWILMDNRRWLGRRTKWDDDRISMEDKLGLLLGLGPDFDHHCFLLDDTGWAADPRVGPTLTNAGERLSGANVFRQD